MQNKTANTTQIMISIKLITCLPHPQIINGFDPIFPSSFPHATTLPVKVMAPMNTPTNTSISSTISLEAPA
jgi:hypothetical protein